MYFQLFFLSHPVSHLSIVPFLRTFLSHCIQILPRNSLPCCIRPDRGSHALASDVKSLATGLVSLQVTPSVFGRDPFPSPPCLPVSPVSSSTGLSRCSALHLILVRWEPRCSCSAPSLQFFFSIKFHSPFHESFSKLETQTRGVSKF